MMSVSCAYNYSSNSNTHLVLMDLVKLSNKRYMGSTTLFRIKTKRPIESL